MTRELELAGHKGGGKMIKIGDMVTLRGKNKNTGKVLKVGKKNYLIDRGYRISLVWAVNVLEHTEELAGGVR